MQNILFAFPRNRIDDTGDLSFKLNSKQGLQPPLGILTAAACLPKDCDVRFVDCNVEPVRPELVQWADIVMSGGTFLQRKSTLEILTLAKEYGKLTVAGGIDTFDAPGWYQQFDHILQGEGELTLPAFIQDLRAGTAKHLYDFRHQRVDISLSPVPRYDLIRMDDYLYPALQFVRGCPFLCEFCSAPILGGRVPRYKKPKQIQQELYALLKLGYRGRVQLNDDNLIGNQEICKQILQEVVQFQKENRYPFWFACYSTMNLCDNKTLLELFREAGISSVFFGIEAVEEEVLKGHSKQQNIRFMNPAAIHRVFSYGIRISAGVIFGADGEKKGHADRVFDFVQSAGITKMNMSILEAVPGTPLFARLTREKRILADSRNFQEVPDAVSNGLNFITQRPKQEILDEYISFANRSYQARNYFARLNKMLKHFNSQSRGSSEAKGGSFHRSLLLKAKKGRWFLLGLIKYPGFGFYFLLGALGWAVRDRDRFLLFLEYSFEGMIKRSERKGTVTDVLELVSEKAFKIYREAQAQLEPA